MRLRNMLLATIKRHSFQCSRDTLSILTLKVEVEEEKTNLEQTIQLVTNQSTAWSISQGFFVCLFVCFSFNRRLFTVPCYLILQDPVAYDDDYGESQIYLYKNYDSVKQQFFARGHLTPNADFSTEQERALTMITTNIAPQWQRFNSGNWNYLEAAIRQYATNTNHDLYVFTGTGM